MADNILDAAWQRESPQADHEDGISVPLSSLDAEVFVDPHHPNKLLEGLNRLRLNRLLCDVILCCEGQEVPCHRHVLASFSPYFEAMFTSGMRESTHDRVTISGVEPQMIGLLVNYAYTSEVSISSDNVQALLAASDLLEFTAVREACCEYMKRHLDTTNCVEIYCSANDHCCESLKKFSFDHMLEHFSVVFQQEEFISLSVERLTEVLCSDHLNVPEEDMVFEAAMLWLDKCPTRKQSFGQVLEHIRLALISPSYLHTVVERLDVVKEQQGCQRFISEAKGEQPYSPLNTARPRRITVFVLLSFTHLVSFDPLTNQEKTLGRLPRYLEDYAVCASGSSLYLTGGDDEDNPHQYMWRYDVLHNSWLRMAPMNEPRQCFSLVMLDGCVFAVGGRGSKESKDTMEKYHPHTDSWRLMESVGVAEHATDNVVALDGHLYFIGGVTCDQLAKYNPETSVWTQLPTMPIPLTSIASIVLNGQIYVTGVRIPDTIPFMMECFNPQTNQWTICASMEVEHNGWDDDVQMVVVDGKLYILGYRLRLNDDYEYNRNDIECYCEETNTWTTVGEIVNARLLGCECVSLKLRRDHGQPIDDDDADVMEKEYTFRQRNQGI